MRSLNIRLEGVVVPFSSLCDHEKVAFLNPISEFDSSSGTNDLEGFVGVSINASNSSVLRRKSSTRSNETLAIRSQNECSTFLTLAQKSADLE